MNDYSVSVEEAKNKFQEMVENTWKDTNEDILRPTPPGITTEILKCILNFSRMANVVYQQKQDGYTNPEKVVKPYIIALFVDSFEI